MNTTWHLWRWAVIGTALVLGLAVGLGAGLPRQAAAQQADGSAGRYTVVSTEGTNLIVTDNKVNTLYFYTVDPGNEPGAELKLRGSVDLTQVGKPAIAPRLTKKVQQSPK